MVVIMSCAFYCHIHACMLYMYACVKVFFFKCTFQINGDAAENLNSRALNSDGEFVDLLMIPVSELHEHLNSKSIPLDGLLDLI